MRCRIFACCSVSAFSLLGSPPLDSGPLGLALYWLAASVMRGQLLWLSTQLPLLGIASWCRSVLTGACRGHRKGSSIFLGACRNERTPGRVFEPSCCCLPYSRAHG